MTENGLFTHHSHAHECWNVENGSEWKMSSSQNQSHEPAQIGRLCTPLSQPAMVKFGCWFSGPRGRRSIILISMIRGTSKSTSGVWQYDMSEPDVPWSLVDVKRRVRALCEVTRLGPLSWRTHSMIAFPHRPSDGSNVGSITKKRKEKRGLNYIQLESACLPPLGTRSSCWRLKEPPLGTAPRGVLSK